MNVYRKKTSLIVTQSPFLLGFFPLLFTATFLLKYFHADREPVSLRGLNIPTAQTPGGSNHDQRISKK